MSRIPTFTCFFFRFIMNAGHEWTLRYCISSLMDFYHETAFETTLVVEWSWMGMGHCHHSRTELHPNTHISLWYQKILRFRTMPCSTCRMEVFPDGCSWPRCARRWTMWRSGVSWRCRGGPRPPWYPMTTNTNFSTTNMTQPLLRRGHVV